MFELARVWVFRSRLYVEPTIFSTKKSNSMLIGYSTTQFCMQNEMNQVLALKRVADWTIEGDVLKRGASCTRTKYLTKFFLICFTPVSVVIKNFHSKAVCSFCHSTTNSSQANNANGWSTNFTSKIAMQMKKLFKKKIKQRIHINWRYKWKEDHRSWRRNLCSW